MSALGLGLSGPPCPDRADLNQSSPDGRPRQAMCCRCGRVTARRDDARLPWCGGTFTWIEELTNADQHQAQPAQPQGARE